MAYIDFDYYKNNGGTITNEATFNLYLNKATLKMDYVTFNRLRKLSTIPNEVSACMVELINNYYTNNTSQASQFGGNLVSSLGNSGVSVSYKDDVGALFDAEQTDLINLYLYNLYDDEGNNLLYRGM